MCTDQKWTRKWILSCPINLCDECFSTCAHIPLGTFPLRALQTFRIFNICQHLVAVKHQLIFFSSFPSNRLAYIWLFILFWKTLQVLSFFKCRSIFNRIPFSLCVTFFMVCIRAEKFWCICARTNALTLRGEKIWVYIKFETSKPSVAALLI